MFILHSLLANFLLIGLIFLAPLRPLGQVDDVQPGSSGKGFNLCETDNIAFVGGEEVIYKIYYNWNFVWLPAGEVTFKTEDLGKTYKLSASGRTYSSYEWFFKVRDYYEAIVEKKTLRPVRTIRDVREGGYALHEVVEYHNGGRKVTSSRKRGDKELDVKQLELSDCVHDILSSIYYTRNQNFEGRNRGFTFPVRVFLDREEYPLTVEFRGKVHKLDVRGLGHFKALSFSPATIPGNVFNDGDRMMIYATDDRNQLPLLIESPVSVGSVKAVLKSYKGLRYPVSSRVNQ